MTTRKKAFVFSSDSLIIFQSTLDNFFSNTIGENDKILKVYSTMTTSKDYYFFCLWEIEE